MGTLDEEEEEEDYSLQPTETTNWNSWKPQKLQLPVSEPLRPNPVGVPQQQEQSKTWQKRRRPRMAPSSKEEEATLLQAKTELVQLMVGNARLEFANMEEECSLRRAILQEKLKQEKIKTKMMEREELAQQQTGKFNSPP